jgi:hypothetical protein
MRMIFAVTALVIAGATTGFAQSSIYGNSNSLGSGLYGTGSNPNSHYVSPYTTNRGTTVPGHYQTNPNNTQLDNYSSRGNLNPYTGSYGTRIPRY